MFEDVTVAQNAVHVIPYTVDALLAFPTPVVFSLQSGLCDMHLSEGKLSTRRRCQWCGGWSHLIVTSCLVIARFTAPSAERITPARSDISVLPTIRQLDKSHLDLLCDKSGAVTHPSFIMMSRRKLALGALYLHNQRYKMTV